MRRLNKMNVFKEVASTLSEKNGTEVTREMVDKHYRNKYSKALSTKKLSPEVRQRVVELVS